MWESLVFRLPWEQESAGSNPAIPIGVEVSHDPAQTQHHEFSTSGVVV